MDEFLALIKGVTVSQLEDIASKLEFTYKRGQLSDEDFSKMAQAMIDEANRRKVAQQRPRYSNSAPPKLSPGRAALLRPSWVPEGVETYTGIDPKDGKVHTWRSLAYCAKVHKGLVKDESALRTFSGGAITAI